MPEHEKRVGTFSVRKLLLPDGTEDGLSVGYASRAGGGKTTHLTYMVMGALKDPAFKNTKFIYTSIKHEDYFNIKDNPPVGTVTEVFENIRKNRVTVFYPPEPEFYEEDIDILIDGIFDLKEANPEATFTLIIDDANILKGFDSRGIPSPSVKKGIIAGRSKGFKMVLMTHKLANLPRLLNGNMSGMVVFNINPMDTDYARKIFGVDLEDELGELGEYRWLWVDLIRGQVEHFLPLSVKG